MLNTMNIIHIIITDLCAYSMCPRAMNSILPLKVLHSVAHLTHIMRINKEKNCCCYFYFAYKATCSDGFKRPATGHMNCEAKVQIQLILVPQPGFNSAPLTLHPAGKSGLINKCFLNHLCSLNI